LSRGFSQSSSICSESTRRAILPGLHILGFVRRISPEHLTAGWVRSVCFASGVVMAPGQAASFLRFHPRPSPRAGFVRPVFLLESWWRAHLREYLTAGWVRSARFVLGVASRRPRAQPVQGPRGKQSAAVSRRADSPARGIRFLLIIGHHGGLGALPDRKCARAWAGCPVTVRPNLPRRVVTEVRSPGRRPRSRKNLRPPSWDSVGTELPVLGSEVAMSAF
jgi:hypothetical protein